MTRLLSFFSALIIATQVQAHELAATPHSWLASLSHPLEHLLAAGTLVVGATALFMIGARRSSIALAVVGALTLFVI